MTRETGSPGVSRRGFLVTSAAAAGGAALIVGFDLGAPAAQSPQPAKAPPNPLSAWVRVARDGSVTLILAKSEMGQGVYTTLPMILAEELDADWSRVRVEQAPTNAAIYDHGTGGSQSVRTSWLPLRRAGAAARQMLVAAAAARWAVDPTTCTTEAGVVRGPAGQSLPYGDLVEAAAALPVPDLEKVPLKDPARFRIIGTSRPRLDIPAKVNGEAVFGSDVRVPGMLYAVVARCPTVGGRVARFDAAKAKALPGVRQVVEIPAVRAGVFTTGGVAVVADSTWAAIQGREALDITWDHGPHAKESSASLRAQFVQLIEKGGTVVRDEGDAAAALAAGGRRVEAEYDVPFEAHAPMEPLNATVHVRADGAEAWIGSQGPQWPQGAIAEIAGVTPDKVVVHTTLLGGGFGRRYHADYVVEAAQVSKAVNAPVQVVWTREDDIRHDFFRPAALHRLAATLDEQGRPAAWVHRMASTSSNALWGEPGKAKLEDSEIGGAVDVPYAVPRIRFEYANAPTGVPVMWWRSVEHSGNAFVIESFVDELAHAARQDPFEYRRALLAHGTLVKFPPGAPDGIDTKRLLATLELAAQKAGWGTPLPQGRGRGIACHYCFNSYAAQVAEVSVQDGRVRVHRIVCAVDVGQVVHPDGVKAQVEGAVAYALSAVKGHVTFRDGQAEQTNFDAFEVIRIDEMPEVEVHAVPSTVAPTGIGEPGLPPCAPAVANAVFAATGKRLRRMPFAKEDLA
jgi:isoquinoline 1-oxidoreductase beta subunit